MTYRPLTAAVAALMAFSLTAPGTSFTVTAQNRDAFDPDKPVDGTVSAAACRPYGFTLPAANDADDRTRYRLTPPPPPSAPMPLAPPRPPVVQTLPNGQTTLDGVVVTGSRVQRSEAVAGVSAYAPPPLSRPLPPGVPPRPADTERYPDATPNPVKRVADEPVSTFSIDVDTAAYANVRRFVDEGRRPPVDAVRIEEMVNYFDYGYARPRAASEPFAITTAVVASPWSPGRQIVHIGLQGYELPEAERRPLNLTFMVDVSGSMHSPDKLALAQKSMNLIIDRLRPQDRVAVTFYASDVGTAVGPTPGDHKLKLRCAVAALNAGGSTAGAQGMVNAYQQAEAAFGRDKVNRILMFT
ncbi:von Willebrand factor type A domain-containing protein, partial [Brevundimonas sp.]|uniref:vWA domain-containing protein n=1 Tax=Brevundimonas sp. TaxID=1871086 RepID=UPI0025C6D62B